jgi:CubicO group peptidase (beta-lactamase class C family)
VTVTLRELLHEGVEQGVFPAAQATVLHEGRVAFDGAAGTATEESIFDLASITKVVGTTYAFMSLWAEGRLSPDTPLAALLPQAAIARQVTLADLLYHRSGLPAFIPFFAHAVQTHPELLEAKAPPTLRQTVRQEVVARALATAPARPPREASVYSDVGFILLGEALAAASGLALDELIVRRVLHPLGSPVSFHRLSAGPSADARRCMATGQERPRAPAVDQEGAWGPLPSRPSSPGEVDDDNAWVMDGVAGHAGLFGSAHALAQLGQLALGDLAGAHRLAPARLWEQAVRKDPDTPGSDRALGWDTPSPQGSSAGSVLGNRPPGALGHLGYTGCSVWVDRARHVVVALCTNCTQSGRGNQPRIRTFRPRFHDAVMKALGF